MAHGPPSNISHAKCSSNEEWDGWRPRYVCRRMNIEFKEREDCDECQLRGLGRNKGKESWVKVMKGSNITKKSAPYYVELSNSYATLDKFLSEPSPPNTAKRAIDVENKSVFKVKAIISKSNFGF